MVVIAVGISLVLQNTKDEYTAMKKHLWWSATRHVYSALLIFGNKKLVRVLGTPQDGISGNSEDKI